MEQVLLSGLSQYKRQSLLFNCFAAVCVLFLLVDEELGIIIGFSPSKKVYFVVSLFYLLNTAFVFKKVPLSLYSSATIISVRSFISFFIQLAHF